MKLKGKLSGIFPNKQTYEFVSDDGEICHGDFYNTDVLEDALQFVGKHCIIDISDEPDYREVDVCMFEITDDTPASTADEKPSKTIAEEEFRPTWETK